MSVPASSDVSRLGAVEVLARIGDEQWVSVARERAVPVPLGAIVLLRREARRAASVHPVTATVVDLLAYSVAFEQSHDRDLRRFHLIADVASSIPVLALEAQLAAEPARLAELIERAVATRSACRRRMSLRSERSVPTERPLGSRAAMGFGGAAPVETR